MTVSLTGTGQDKDLAVSYGSVTMSFHLTQLSYNGDDTFNFQENGLTWLLRVAETSVSIEATVAKRTGKSLHTLGYDSFGAALTVDTSGNLHVGGAVHVSRPIIVGANRKPYALCSPWTSDSQGISFTCDDTAQMVSAVAPGVGQVPGQEMAELQHSQKFMKEINTAVMRQTRMITGDFNISRRIRHFREFRTDG